MSNPVAVLLREVDVNHAPLGESVWVWCPGCDMAHRFQTNSLVPGRIEWGFNGDLEKPTFTPSYKTWHGADMAHVCHSYLRDGVWEFLDDCTHALAGQHVAMVPVPDWLCKY